MTDERRSLPARLEMYANECGGGQLEADLLEAARMLRQTTMAGKQEFVSPTLTTRGRKEGPAPELSGEEVTDAMIHAGAEKLFYVTRDTIIGAYLAMRSLAPTDGRVSVPVDVLAALYAYGLIHTVSGVTCKGMTHEDALKVIGLLAADAGEGKL